MVSSLLFKQIPGRWFRPAIQVFAVGFFMRRKHV